MRGGKLFGAMILAGTLLAGCAQLPFLSPAPQPNKPVIAASAEDITRQQELVTAGDAALAQGKTAEAIQHYTDANAISGGGSRAAFSLADVRESQQDRQGAILALEQAHNTQLPDAQLDARLGEYYLAAGEDAKAAAVATRGLESAPQDAALLNITALVADRAGEHEKAQTLYRGVLENPALDASSAEYTRHNLALSYIVSNQPKSAILLLQPEGKPTHKLPKETRQLLALAYGAAGEEDKAYELGLADLGVDEAAENVAFYRRFREEGFQRESLLKPATE
ncbi:MAG: hypothetical protein FJX23_07495 [Alphaproteobacteria bacterium]|nr:hypothetical protein [Alphaproteobacteria bacterium]